MENQIATIREILISYLNSFLEAVPRIVLALLILMTGMLLVRWVGRLSQRRILIKAKDPIIGGFLITAFKTLLYIGVTMLVLHAAGLTDIAAGLLAGAGASAVILGFAFKDIGQNFLSGIILAFNRPFHINDSIQVGEVFGKVKSLQFRYTHIKTFDGQDVYIPNSDVLTKPVRNYTADGFFRWSFIVGIAYEDRIEDAKMIIQQILDEHPGIVHDDVHENYVAEDELATSTVNLKVFFWVDTTDFRRTATIIRGKVIQAVKEKLVENKFNLPSDVKEIKLYGGADAIPLRILSDGKGE